MSSKDFSIKQINIKEEIPVPYKGSDSLKTSTSNEQVILNKPSNWTYGYHFKTFEFINVQSCTVIINETDTIYLNAGQGFRIDKSDDPIHSFVIVEDGITYNWVGSY